MSSGRSTPKRISFAELPKSYAGDAGSGRGFGDRKGKSRARRKKRGGTSTGGKGGEEEEEEEGAWWLSWLIGGGSTRGMSSAEERTEARMARSWGGSARFGGGMEEWGV